MAFPSMLSTPPRFGAPTRARVSFLHLWSALALTLCLCSSGWSKPRWAAVDPADLTARDSAAAPGIDTEILFSRHVLSDDSTNSYIRAKVYTKKGVETLSVLSIDHGTGAEISQLAARVVKMNGSVVELRKADFHESVRWKHGYVKGKRTTFAFPNVEPGDIVEYTWDQKVPLVLYGYHRVFCQAENVFTREYSFETKSSQMDFNVIWANCPNAEHDPKTKKVVIRDLPPFIAEKDMPPEADIRSSLTVVFTHPLMRILGGSGDWTITGILLGSIFESETEPDKATRAKAAELTADSPSLDESVRRIYRFVQTEIRNLDTDSSPDLASAKKKRARADETPKPGKILANRTGTTWDINILFASLVRSTGLSTYMALGADREQMLNLNIPNGWIFADRRLIVVDYGNRYGFYTPAEPLVPFEMLNRKDEGATVFVCGSVPKPWITTPVAPAAATTIHRVGQFTLDSSGTLEGMVEVKMTGHHAMDARQAYRDKSEPDAIETLRTQLVDRLPTADPSALQWSNADNNDLPFILRYKVRVPGYAEPTETRLLLAPNFFTANTAVRFPEETRRYPIYLGTAEKFIDEIELSLPPDYTPDGMKDPAWIGDISSVVFNTYHLTFSPHTHTLSYRREHTLGDGGRLNLRKESYAPLRRIFDQVHRSDVHQVVLKPAESSTLSAVASDPTPPSL